MRKIWATGDWHCGHLAGLTPPFYQIPLVGKQSRFNRIQEETWKWLISVKEKSGRPDLLIINGDAIEGSGRRSGGTELIYTDRREQAKIAIEAIKQIHPKMVTMTYGTQSHTGEDGEDWDEVIADAVGAEIHGHDQFEIEKLVFDIKHHIGGSGIPHGRYTAMGREQLWAKLLADTGLTYRPDIIIRSHVHYFRQVSDGNSHGFILPALQGMGSKYGTRRCSGVVDMGFVEFNVKSKKEWSWVHHKLVLKSQVRPLRKL